MTPDEIQLLPPLSPSALEANEPRIEPKVDVKAVIKAGTRDVSKTKAFENADPIIVKTEDQSCHPDRPSGHHPLRIPPLTGRQKFYIIVLQMIGAAILDGAFNFGIACAMYLNAPSVRIWILTENTVAGDMAITIFIQGILTFCIASGMVHVDLRKNKVDAFPYPWPDTAWGTAAKKDPEATRSVIVKWWRKFNNDQGFSRGLHFFSGSDVNDIFNRQLTSRQFFRRLFWSIWKGSVLSVIYFFILWPISVAIVAPIWEHDQLAGKYTAPLIKGVYGAVYGLIQNPVCAMIAMGSEDSVRHHRAEIQRQRFENPEKSAMTTTAAERVSMAVRPGSVFTERRTSLDLLTNLESSPGAKPRTLSTRRVDSLRRSLDGAAQVAHHSSSIPTESTYTSAGLAWRSTDVHRRVSVDHHRSRSRYDPQIPRRSATITATVRPHRDSSAPPRSQKNTADMAHPSSEEHFGDQADQVCTPFTPMRRLTETSIVFDRAIFNI